MPRTCEVICLAFPFILYSGVGNVYKLLFDLAMKALNLSGYGFLPYLNNRISKI